MDNHAPLFTEFGKNRLSRPLDNPAVDQKTNPDKFLAGGDDNSLYARSKRVKYLGGNRIAKFGNEVFKLHTPPPPRGVLFDASTQFPATRVAASRILL